MRKATNTAYDALLAQVREKCMSAEEIAADGWKTTIQWANEWGKCDSQAGKLIRALVRKNIWESKKFPVQNYSRGTYPTLHYRPKA